MKPYAIGIDKLGAGLVNREGQILAHFTTRAHAEQPPEQVIKTIVTAFEAVLSSGGVAPSEIEAVRPGWCWSAPTCRPGVTCPCVIWPAPTVE